MVFFWFQKLRLALLGAIFMLLRPSVPWCFPIREVSCEQQQQQQQQLQQQQLQQQQQQQEEHQQQQEKAAKIMIFYWFQKLG